MKCPRTGGELKSITLGKISVDVSQSCGGVFFDNFELKHFDERHEMKGDELVHHLSQFHSPIADESEKINCPKCVDAVMMRRYYSPKKRLEIDECPQCGGIWLDTGELETLRKIFLSDAEIKAFTEQLVAEVESHPRVIKENEAFEESINTMENLTKALWRSIGIKKSS